MNSPHVVRRLLAKITSVALVLLLTPLAILIVRQHILRHRGEALQADIQSIRLRETTFQDVQPIFQRWKRWGRFDGSCSSSRCVFDVNLSTLGGFLQEHPHVSFLAEHIGLRPCGIFAHLVVLNGRVWEEWIALAIETRETYLAGEAFSDSKLHYRFMRSSSHWRSHPEYTIYIGPNSSQNMVRLEFTPYANPDETRRLMFLDFTCLTRISSCRDGGQIMPAAMAQAKVFASLPKDDEDTSRECVDPLVLELFSRESASVAIAKATSIERSSFPKSLPLYDVTFTFERFLKLGSHVNTKVGLAISTSAPPLMEVSTHVGDEVVFFFDEDRIDRDAVAGCGGPVLLTNERLSAIRRGIAEDTSPPGLFAYDHVLRGLPPPRQGPD